MVPKTPKVCGIHNVQAPQLIGGLHIVNPTETQEISQATAFENEKPTHIITITIMIQDLMEGDGKLT